MPLREQPKAAQIAAPAAPGPIFCRAEHMGLGFGVGGVSENRGPQYSTLNTRILIKRTGTPNLTVQGCVRLAMMRILFVRTALNLSQTWIPSLQRIDDGNALTFSSYDCIAGALYAILPPLKLRQSRP